MPRLKYLTEIHAQLARILRLPTYELVAELPIAAALNEGAVVFVKETNSLHLSNASEWIDLEVKVNPSPVNYVPAPTGNTANLNQFIIASDGTDWFIDHLGNAKRMTLTAGHIEITTHEKGFIHKDSEGERHLFRSSPQGVWFSQKL